MAFSISRKYLMMIYLEIFHDRVTCERSMAVVLLFRTIRIEYLYKIGWNHDLGYVIGFSKPWKCTSTFLERSNTNIILWKNVILIWSQALKSYLSPVRYMIKNIWDYSICFVSRTQNARQSTQFHIFPKVCSTSFGWRLIGNHHSYDW
jgi:hypothetical protein